MKRKNLYFLFSLLLALNVVPMQAQGDVMNQADGYEWPTDKQVLQKLDAWQDLKFGVLIHWGLYAVPGIVESWNICNEDWVKRPEGSKYEEYKQWYWGLSKEFNPVDFDPDQWATVCHEAGMKYVIFTTKHHDGFCMYDSKYTDFTVAKGPFASQAKADVAKYVFEAFRKQNFMVGAYFSKPDWHCEGFWNPYYATPNRHPNYKKEQHPDWWQSYVTFTKNQLGELTEGRYGQLDILWLDGGWIKGDDVGLNEILPKAREISPGLICVDRTIQGPNENYQTPERMVPDHQILHPWESCLPLSNDWGWVKNAPYKSARQVINTLAEICAKGGCLVLGVGPTAKGIIEEREVKILHEIGDWLNRCGEAIYNTRPAKHFQDGNVWYTISKDAQKQYAIYTLQDRETLPESIELHASGRVVLLNTGKRLRAKQVNDRMVVSIPKNTPTETLAFKISK